MSDYSYVVTDLDGRVLRSGVATDYLNASIQANGDKERCLVGIVANEGDMVVGGEVIPALPVVPTITINQVKAEQGRRLRYTDWAVARAADPTDGRPVPEAILAERAAIRAGASALEAMDPIPPDYRDEKYWR